MAPTQLAVVTTDGSVTYQELLDAASHCARALAADGVGPGQRVALLTNNRIEWLACAFGCAAVGAILAPLNTWVKTWDLDYLLAHARPTVLIAIDQVGAQDFVAYLRQLMPHLWSGESAGADHERYPSIRSVVVIGDNVPPKATRYADWLSSAPAAVPSGLAAEPADIAMVLYTSGSTARPKAVALKHGHLVENGYEIGERQGLTTDDRIFLASPLCWAFGGANALMACLTHGSTLVLQAQFEATEALRMLERHACTSIYTLPVMTRNLLAVPGFDPAMLPDLRKGVTLGSAAEIVVAAQRLGVDQICNIYGSTETYGNCCVTPHNAPEQRRAASQGPPLPGTELRIVDPESGDVMPRGQIGEILVRGRISPGYMDVDGHSHAVTDAEGFLHTGDLGWLDADGWLTFSARDSEMIKTAGINVSPVEVEEYLRTHPDVEEVAVAGGEDPVRGQQVVAFVRLQPAANLDPQELRDWCKQSIASYKVPALFLNVDALPTTPTGKLARRELSALATEALINQAKDGNE